MQISILLLITGTNSLLSMRTLKMIRQHELKISFLLKYVNMARFADLSFLLQDKDAENSKKASKVALTLFRSYLEEKGLTEGELITMFE